MSQFKERPSAPPPPPPPFDPGRVPANYQQADAHRRELETEHTRMKPAQLQVDNTIRHGIPELGERINPAPPTVDANYPAWRYHRTKAPEGVIINSEAHELVCCAGGGWRDKPFPRDIVAPSQHRLEQLDALLQIGEVAQIDETAEEVLARILKQHKEFALKLAIKAPRGKKETEDEPTAA